MTVEQKLKISVYKKKYYQENKERLCVRSRAYRKKNKKKVVEQEKAYYKRNKKKIAEKRKIRYTKNRKYLIEVCGTSLAIRNNKLKLEVFSHYCGGEPYCQCPGCPTKSLCFLQLDHKNGNGKDHRDSEGRRLCGASLWRFVKLREYPGEFQILCINCNFRKSNKKNCPRNGKSH